MTLTWKFTKYELKLPDAKKSTNRTPGNIFDKWGFDNS